MDNDEATLSPTQRRVLATLKRHGDATADELAESLEISRSAVRQHLSSLRSAGLVAAKPERGHTGRPADRYHATALTESMFATPADDLAVDILDHLDHEDPGLVDRVFESRRQRLVNETRAELEGLTTQERVAALTGLLDDQGYLADFEQADDGSYRINLHGCPMWTVADRFRQACTAELGYVEDLIPDADVRRTSHKTAGAHTCIYEVIPRD